MDYVIDYNGYYTDNNALGTSYPLNHLSELSASFLETYQKYTEPAYGIDWSAGYISAQHARELIIETLEKSNRIYIQYEKSRTYLERFTGKYYGNMFILENMNFQMPTKFFAKACSHHKNRETNHCSLRNALVCTLWLTNQTLLSRIVNQGQNQGQIEAQVQTSEALEQEERSSALNLKNTDQHKKLRKSLKSSENIVTEKPRSSEKRKNARSEMTGEEFEDLVDLVINDVVESPDSDNSVMSDSNDEDDDISDDKIMRQSEMIDALINDEEIFGQFNDDIDAILKSRGVHDKL
ncbi:hypothetical protein KQX54_014300 [Cotesia glomerata]|uniref:Uncharacterized protein n=1 Tax=Cotesia glomerata TaxID=32391 RepID=A0AAV7IP74_COTGL|nr:hypothetical protein KQX54_014300 [Cotesia glomerata]